MINDEIPAWLTTKQEYIPPKDKASFLNSSQKATVKLLSSFNLNSTNYKTKEANTTCRLFGLLLMIVLTALSKNFGFVLFMIALSLVRIATLKAERIKALFKVLLPALLISALILIPSIFMGNPKTPATILGKILVCTSLVMVVNLTAPFNEITRSLKLFYVPNVIIFTFDLTIKYIVLLGQVCYDMLTAMKMRSIGRNNDKRTSMSGILGTVFIKAKNASEDTARAMECRGFDGKYVVTRNKKFTALDFIYVICIAAVIGVFVYLEVIV